MWLIYTKGNDGFEDIIKFYSEEDAMDAFENYENMDWADPDVDHLTLTYEGGYIDSRYTAYSDDERRVN